MAVFTSSVLDEKYFLVAKFGSINQICQFKLGFAEINGAVHFFISTGTTIFGKIWSKKLKLSI